MLFVVAVWGSTFVLIKGALADATPAAFNLVRMTLAFIVLAVAYHRYWRAIRPWQVASGALVGLCLGAGYQFQTTGLALTTPSKSAFITGLLVVLVPLFSLIPGISPPGTRPPRWNAFVGAALAFAGIVLLTAPVLPNLRDTLPALGCSPACCPIWLRSTSATCLHLGAPSDSHSTASCSATFRHASDSSRWRCCRWAFAHSSWR